MAAVSDSPLARVVELRHLRGGDLDLLLDEETQAWHDTLDWDFRGSAGLVRRFLEIQALNGYALLINGYPVGYCYYVAEERKGLIGDLYVMKNYLSVENEERLLTAVVEGLMKTPLIRRIESQLMMLRTGPAIVLPERKFVRTFIRNFMEIEGEMTGRLPERQPSQAVWFDGWTERKQDEAATLIASAYQGHIDSEINDQYRSPAGARRFLMNIVQYPGCGSFFQPASFVAIEPGSGRLAGICLASLVQADVGHVTQVCVSKAARGTGVGYELIRRSLNSLVSHGCRKVTLTVTGSNAEAIGLYERMGFRKTRNFAAHVWDTVWG
ncbi:MAG TPA: GNAT family N-acetyltransferase [Bryobacteraceae bacterium]|jgi:ribosomal protein S18 acetylase RimI-like enzyme|nr:GNAT family N-acetyltransferase [Bryobacteraceae bacterium]